MTADFNPLAGLPPGRLTLVAFQSSLQIDTHSGCVRRMREGGCKDQHPMGLGPIYDSEERRGDSSTLSRQRCCVPIPRAAHLYRFGGEAGHQVKTPVRGRVQSPTTAFCARGHVVEHRVNMVMRSPKIERNPRIGVVPYRLGWSSMS
jgi:hypothetical protein